MKVESHHEWVVALGHGDGAATDLVLNGEDFYLRRTEIAVDGSVGPVMRIRFDPHILGEAITAIQESSE